MDYLAPVLTVFLVSFAALVSPGPDFFCVLRNALAHGARTGLVTAAGISLGIFVHVAYCIVGLAFVISRSVALFTALKWVGAAYLLWLAAQAFRSRGWDGADAARCAILAPPSSRRAFFQGFATNVLNPKATLFFMALFTQVIDPLTPAAVQAAYGLMCASMTLGWFSLVAVAMTRAPVRVWYKRRAVWCDRFCGLAFVGLAARLLLSRA